MDAEVFVVGSKSGDDEMSQLLRESFSRFRLLPFEKNMGYGRLVNAGLAKAGGDFLVILNSDMILKPDSLKKMVDYMSANPEIGILGPQLLNINETIQESCFAFHRPMTVVYRRTFLGKTKGGQKEIARFSMKDFDHRSAREVDWMMGTALMTRRQALEEVGPMDERFFMYFEDTDWCRRFWRAGWKVVYYPDAQMYHYHGRASKKSGGITDIFFNKYTWIHIASALKYFSKYGWRAIDKKA